MATTTAPPHNSWYHLRKVLRLFGKLIIGLLLLIILVFILIQTPPVQNFARKKIQSYLSDKLKTKVVIGKLYLGLPDIISLQNIYIEDRSKDTLLSGGKVKVDIDLFKLINNVVEINEIQLEQVTAKVKRLLPDTVYNFQFIVDAFTPANKKPVNPNDSSVMEMDISSILLNKVRVVYKDEVTGNDMDININHLTTTIDKFDPYKMVFDIPETEVNGLKARIYQTKPLVSSVDPLSKDMAEAVQPILMDLGFKNVHLQNIDVDYRNDVSAFYNQIKIGDLVLQASKVDLPNRILKIDLLKLDKTNTVVRLGNKEEAQKVAQEVKQEVQAQSETGWRILADKVEINDNNLKFDDDSKARLAHGMDYSHLDAKNLTLHLDKLLFSGDSISATIKKGVMREKSGFVLNRFEGNLLFADTEAFLRNLIIETPGSIVRRDIILTYPSLETVTKDPSLLKMNIDLRDTRVQVKDLLVFAPQLISQPAFQDKNATWYLNGRLRGNLSNLQIETLQARGLNNTTLDISGSLVGLVNPTSAKGNLRINKFVTSKQDLQVFIPANTFPENITLPDYLSMSGTILGNIKDVSPNLSINTSLGNVYVKGRIRNADVPDRMSYDLNLVANNLNVGTIIQNPTTVGKITGTVRATGSGIDPKLANAKFNGVLQSAVINNYNYKNFRFDGSIAAQQMQFKAGIVDPNINLALEASGNFLGEFPAVKFSATIDSIKALPLNLSATEIAFRGKVAGDFSNTDPDNLIGNMVVTEALFTNFNQRFEMDSIEVVSGKNDTGRFLRLKSDAAFLELAGEYRLTQIGYVFQNSIQPHFSVMPSYQAAQIAPYNFTINASILDRPLWRILVPGLTKMETVLINGNFSNVGGWKLTADAPSFVYTGNTFDRLHVEFGSADQSGIALKGTIDHLKNGNTMNIYGISLTGTAANNQIDFGLNIKDKKATDKYRLGVLIKQPVFGDYIFSLKQGDLLLNYETWTVPADNNITIRNNDLHINDLVLTRAGQKMSVNSRSAEVNSPIDLSFSQFKLGTFSGFMQADTTFVDGVLNGNAELRNLMQQPVFTTDMTITDLSVKQDTIGNARIKVNNVVQNTYSADVTITGRGNDLQMLGQYVVKEGNNSSYDLIVDIRQLQLATLEGASMGSINGAAGFLSGNVKLNGTLKEPNIIGELDFNKAGMNVVMLNSYFTIDQEKLIVNNEGLQFNTFTIKDSAGNSIVIDGMAATNNFTNYRFDLDVDANDFRAINTTKRNNSLFYGKLYLNSDLHIGGTESQPIIDGGVKVNPKTDFTVVLPQQQPGIIDREGIVEFIDVDATMSDSVLLAPYYCLNNCQLVGFDVSANIEIDKEAVLSMVVDEANGDFIRMKGEGILSGGIDQSGKITLTGSYSLNEGAYELSFNFIKRRFNIEKGSTITWFGEPTSAKLDVKAFYIANTAPLDLVDNQIAENSVAIRNTYRQRLPFQVYLKLEGNLLKPLLTFDVVLPTDKNYNVSRDIINTIDMRLAELRQEPSELNKQAFSLLLLNRFMAENPFDNNNGGGLNAATFARQSVSKILTEQLNKLAGNLIQGVDINFDVISSEDYTTGERRDRTDFNVSLSKQLLSDRLTVKVGSNFELEGPKNGTKNGSALAGDVAFDYKLSKDGKYMLRGYRRNEFQGVVEGYIIETGVSFIITLDYNRFRELFQKKKIQTIKRDDQPVGTEGAQSNRQEINDSSNGND